MSDKQIKTILFALLVVCTVMAIYLVRLSYQVDKVQASTMAAWWELDQFRAKLKEVDAKTRPEAIQKSFLEWLERRDDR